MNSRERGPVVVTGAAGYVGSLLVARLLAAGRDVLGLDALLFGGDAVLPYMSHPSFRFRRVDLTEGGDWVGLLEGADVVVHLAAIVGFPACQSVGRTVTWRYNVQAAGNLWDAAARAGVRRFILASTTSIYGSMQSGPVDEDAAIHPPSLYAESKAAAEKLVRERAERGRMETLILRMASLYGLSPRTRFDVLVNQFVLDALTRRRVVIYQRGYTRSFLHVADAVQGILDVLKAPSEGGGPEILNLGDEGGNRSKDEVVQQVQKHVPGTEVVYRDLTFGGSMRDLSVSYDRIRRRTGFTPRRSLEVGIREVLDALQNGLIQNPADPRHRNARFIVQ